MYSAECPSTGGRDGGGAADEATLAVVVKMGKTQREEDGGKCFKIPVTGLIAAFLLHTKQDKARIGVSLL